MSSVSRRDRLRAKRQPLDRERILHAAVELAERQGLEALSMRTLGSQLGVEAMSLYHHVESKQALLDGVVETVVASMDVSGMHGEGPWEARLKEGFRAYLRLAREYPAVFPLVGRRPVRTLAALEPVDVALGVLMAAGFPPRTALYAFRTLSSFAYGYALSEIRGFAMESASAGGAPRRDVEGDAERFPNLAEVLPLAGATEHDVEFEEGLDVIIAGLKKMHGLPGGLGNA
jgi:AcrR family transcriptional regulator